MASKIRAPSSLLHSWHDSDKDNEGYFAELETTFSQLTAMQLSKAESMKGVILPVPLAGLELVWSPLAAFNTLEPDKLTWKGVCSSIFKKQQDHRLAAESSPDPWQNKFKPSVRMQKRDFQDINAMSAKSWPI